MKRTVLLLTALASTIWSVAQTTFNGQFALSSTAVFQNDIINTSDGNLAIAGAAQGIIGNSDIFLAKITQGGDTLFNKVYGGFASESSTRLVQTSDGGYLLSGSSADPSLAGNSLFLLKTDDLGNVQWQKGYFDNSISQQLLTIGQVSGGYYSMSYNRLSNNDTYYKYLKYDLSGNVTLDTTYLLPNGVSLIDGFTSSNGKVILYGNDNSVQGVQMLEVNPNDGSQIARNHLVAESFGTASTLIQGIRMTPISGGKIIAQAALFNQDLFISSSMMIRLNDNLQVELFNTQIGINSVPVFPIVSQNENRIYILGDNVLEEYNSSLVQTFSWTNSHINFLLFFNGIGMGASNDETIFIKNNKIVRVDASINDGSCIVANSSASSLGPITSNLTSTATSFLIGASGTTTTTDLNFQTQDFHGFTSNILAATTEATDATCAGNDGTASATVTGGTGPYGYQWNDPGNQNTATATGLTPGNYEVTITDITTLCTITENVVVGDGCPSVPATQVRSSDCGTTVTVLTQQFRCDPVMGATNYEWEFDNGAGVVLTKRRNNGQTNMWFGAVNGITNGTTYAVRVRAFVAGVWGDFATACDISSPAGGVPTTQLLPASCNVTANSLSFWIYCAPVNGATDYEFRFTDQVTGDSFTRLRGGPQPSMNLIVVPGLSFGSTYDVDVRAIQSSTAGNYAVACPVQLGASGPPTTGLNSSFCGTTVASTGNIFFCDAVPGATDYEWRFTSTTDGSVHIRRRGNGQTNMLFNAVQGIQENTTYTVDVRPKLSGSFANFGPTCELSTPGAALTNNSSSSVYVFDDVLAEEAALGFDLEVFPNPSNGNGLTVVLDGLNRNAPTWSVQVLDLSGKRIYHQQFAGGDSYVMKQIQFEHQLPQGFYILNVSAGEQSNSSKLIIQR